MMEEIAGRMEGRGVESKRADPVREGEHTRKMEREREVMGGSCVPASPLWLGTCWAIWRPCNWVGVLHLSGPPPTRDGWKQKKKSVLLSAAA